MEKPNNMAQGAAAAPDTDRIKQLQFQVNDVKNIMAQNIEEILTREEKLEDVRNKSEDMRDRAKDFKHTTTRVARAYWWKNVKLMVVIFVIVAIIILIIVLLATGVIPTGK